MSDTITENVTAEELSNTNNVPYTIGTGLDPTVGVDDNIIDLLTRINMLTFENIAQNLASLNSREVYPEPKLKVKTFYIKEDNTITLTIDRRIEGTIVKTITGTNLPKTFTKTIKRIKGIVTDKIYS